MKKYLIERGNKYFTTFGNDYDKKGKLKVKPIFGTIEMAVYFSSLNDAELTAYRVKGNVVEFTKVLS